MGAIARVKEHPKGFWFIFWGELAERASYYGMRTLLAFYLLDVLLFHKNTGAEIMQFFIAACYVAPLLGGYVADRWLGRYKTILYFAPIYILGHIILGGIPHRWAMFCALFLLALGSGSIKPNTTTLMGMMYEEQKKSYLLTEASSYFYAAINVGAVLSTFVLPLVQKKWGYGPALMIPAVQMALSFFFFAIGKRYYPHEEVHKQPPKTAEQKAAEWETLKRIAGIFFTIAIFWFVYDQNASTWMYFARDRMNMTVLPAWHFLPHALQNFKLLPPQLQSFNPFLIIIFTPLFNWTWEKWKQKRGGVGLPDTRKMLIGFGIVIVCMAAMAFAGYLSESGKVTVWWELLAIFVITLSELCISVVGLEFAYKVAAPGTKSTVTGAFLFTVFVGDFFGGFFDRLYAHLAPGTYFGIQTLIIIGAALLFVAFARRFERNGATREATLATEC